MAEPTTGPSDLVGRERELGLLLGHLSKAILGQGSTVLLIGDAGIGKTRLAKQLLATAAQGGCQCFTGRANASETSFPYAVVSDAMQPFLRSASQSMLSRLLRQESRLARVFPCLSGRVTSRTSEVVLDPGQEKALLLEAFYEFLHRLTEQGAVVLFLDDLQWADASSLELVHYVARNLRHDRILLIGAYRSEDLPLNLPLKSAIASLSKHGEVVQISLPPLSLEESHQLIKLRSGCECDPSAGLVDFLQGVARGNPLYLEGILASLLQSGQVLFREGQCHYHPTEEIPVPHSIRDFILARLEGVERDDRDLLEIASVLGTTFTYPVFQAVTGRSEESLLLALDRLRQWQVLREKAEGDTVVYDFAHPLLRETIYQQLGVQRRRVLHAIAARVLESSFPGRPDEHAAQLAYHYSQATGEANRAKALHYLMAAGDQSLAVYANREALRHLQAVLGRLDPGEGGSAADSATSLRPEVRTKIGECHYRLGEFNTAISDWKIAETEYGPGGDPRLRADLHRRMAKACWQKGESTKALDHYSVGLDLLGEEGYVLERANLHQEMARVLQAIGRVSEALDYSDNAVALAEKAEATALLGEAYQVRASIHGLRGGVGLAQSYLAKSLEFAGERPGAAWEIYRTLGELAIISGDLPSAKVHINSCLEIAERTGITSFLCSPYYMLAYIRWLTCEWNEGLSLAEKAINLSTRLGQLADLPFSLAYAAFLHCSRGDTGLALKSANESLDAAEAAGQGPVGGIITAHTALAYIYLSAGDPHQAREHSLRSLEYADRTGYALYALHRASRVYAEACLGLNLLDEASRHIDSTVAIASRLRHRPALAGMHRAKGLLHAIHGVEAAVDELRASIQGWEELGYHYEAAKTKFELALAYQSQGEPELATGELLKLLGIYSQWGAAEDVARTRKALMWFGKRPPRRRPSDRLGIPDGLTEREVEIIRLVAQHKSTEEISQELVIRQATTNTHLANIFKKLDIGSRAELISYAREKGLS